MLSYDDFYMDLYMDDLRYPNDYKANEEDEHYTPSAENGDYSPTHPWDAPGMSIRDFI